MNPQEQQDPTPASEMPPPAPQEKVGPEYWKKPKRSKLKYLLILIVLAAILAAGYWFLVRSKPAKVSSTTQTQSSSQSPAILLKTDHYDSSNFNLGLDYPNGWTLTDTAGSGKLTIVSQPTQLTSASGQAVTGQIIMSIRDKTQKLTEFDKGAATAVRDSEKIAYTKPTQTQRGSTYISFLQYATTAGGGSLDGIYITGDGGYQKAQDIPMADISKSDPVIDITFIKCADSKCTGSGTPLSLQQKIWDDSSFAKPLKNLLESLAIN